MKVFNTNWDGIPASMRKEKRWVGWNERKEPINPNTLKGANTANAATWATFDQARAVIGLNSTVNERNGETMEGPVLGVGFVLGGGWIGVDLDGGTEHGAGEVDAGLLADFDSLHTFSEVSKSGAGYHFIGLYRGEELQGCQITKATRDMIEKQTGKQAPSVEVYSRGRYFAITGNRHGEPYEAVDVTQGLAELHEKYIAGPNRVQRESVRQTVTVSASATPGSSERAEFLRVNIRDILAFIPASCSRAEWVSVAGALKLEGFDFSVFDDWSKTCSEKYDPRETQKAWNSCRRTSGNASNGGTLVNMAKSNGWKAKTLTGSYKQTAAQDFSTVAPRAERAEATPSAGDTVSAPVGDAAHRKFKTGIEALTEFMDRVQNPNFKPISTGFNVLDTQMGGGLYSGLCVLSGASSEGKSALSMQIIENMARYSRKNALVFSFEMSADQLIARSLSRLSFNTALNSDAAVTNLQALQGNRWNELADLQKQGLKEALQAFKTYFDRITIVDDCPANIDAVEAAAEAYIHERKTVPVILIDYLQLFDVRKGATMADGMKDITLRLKQFSIRHDTVILLVSSVNRKSAEGGIEFNSAYGSSFVEYSADYQMALEFQVFKALKMGKKLSDKLTNKEELKKSPIREMMITLQKNRMGQCGACSGFRFNAAYSDFKQESEEEFAAALACLGVDDAASDEKSTAKETVKVSARRASKK